MNVVPVPALSDNYVFVLRDEGADFTTVIDPAEAEPIVDFLSDRGWPLNLILNTHHHHDHVGGIDALSRNFDDVTVVMSSSARDGEEVPAGSTVARVLSVPGHTLDHVAYWFEKERALFCGDTLFSIGCGRVFEGTHAQLFASLGRLKELPDETLVYCAHEYTQSNCRFALHVDPENALLREFSRGVDERRKRGEATVPSRLGDEKRLNPFLRAEDLATFRSLRDRKDRF